MLGQNPKRPPEFNNGDFLYVKKIFKTLQGEGPNVGVPGIFIRLGGCNLACDFCDTDFEDYQQYPLSEILQQVLELSLNPNKERSVSLVVITGGEPFRQNIAALCEALIKNQFNVQIETNGTLFRQIPEEVEVICSPKISNNSYLSVHPDLLPRVNSLKFLVSATKNGYNQIPELGQTKYKIPVFLQAMDEYNEQKNIDNKKLAVALTIDNNYRLSYQIHKELNIE